MRPRRAIRSRCRRRRNSPKRRKGGRFRARLPASSLRRLCTTPLRATHHSDRSRRTSLQLTCVIRLLAAPDTPFLRTPAFRPRPCGPVSIPASRRGPSEPQAFRPGIRHLTFRPTLQSGPCGPFLGQRPCGPWVPGACIAGYRRLQVHRHSVLAFAPTLPPRALPLSAGLATQGPRRGPEVSGSSQRPEQQRRSPFLMSKSNACFGPLPRGSANHPQARITRNFRRNSWNFCLFFRIVSPETPGSPGARDMP